MADDSFPESVRNLLREQLTTFEQLEILLWLREHPETPWSAQALSERMRFPRELSDEALRRLELSGLIERHGEAEFRFAARSPQMAEAVATLSALYRDQRASVMSVMSISAIERIRSSTMRAFADSFVLGKKNRDG